jgi:CDP-diacylglycerol---glycerol-3-phosphate 3-phosphatidyltransferase
MTDETLDLTPSPSYARARAESLGVQAKVGIAERATRLVSILVATGLAAG